MMVEVTKAISGNEIKNGGVTVIVGKAAFKKDEVSSMNVETFNSSATWVCPEHVTEVVVEAWGGGGIGGSRSSNGGGGGGGGGAYVRTTVTVVPGQSYTVNVAAIGNGLGVQDSYFKDTNTVLARGGLEGVINTATGVAGGSASMSIGDTKHAGHSGGDSDGTAGAYGGNGGNNGTLAGSGGPGATVQGDGSVGVAPGGGGGGALRTSSGGQIGGFGAGGRIILTYKVNNPNVAGDVTVMQNKWDERFDDAGYYTA